ncbi:hypothetical protein AFK24_07690 [Pseudomonas syringae]|uniref:Uncharacterized protein n=1 Tax=Pseudomonas syringae TaxID=317 RepID=A0A1C7Z6Z5_PSESX|nr:hypothetical protein [Pseudomonas syringae]OCR25603.1 hypothetical protein AFK24_07690 [Pseudomonas syringae]
MTGNTVVEIREGLIQFALFRIAFDCTTKFHPTLVFLLTAGFDGAVRVIMMPSHILSPNACVGIQNEQEW